VKRQPIPPPLSDEEAEALAVPNKEDAQAMWRQDAPPKGRDLLDAPEYEGEDGG
jgi:hypothetical protein